MESCSVLVVDDEEACCDILKNYLKDRFCIVDVARNGYRAADLLRVKDYDIALIDCSMPGMSGLELVRMIKARSSMTCCVMISGYDLVDESMAKEAGVDLFLTKPIPLVKVMKAVDDIRGRFKRNADSADKDFVA